jgi:hypothetical protein
MSREHEMDSVMERIITPMMIMMTSQNLQFVASLMMIYQELVNLETTELTVSTVS